MVCLQFLRKILPICLTMVCLAPTRSAEARSASVKAMGMGECAVAYPQDTLSNAWNPACAMFIGNRFDANVGWLRTRGEATVLNNTVVGSPSVTYKSDVHPTSFDPEFGANYIVCGSCDVAVGFIGYNKSYFQTHYRSPIPFFGKTQPSMELIQEVLSPLVALRLDAHTFALALQFTGERFKASGLENFATSAFSVEPVAVTNNGHEYSYGLGFAVGWLWHAYPGLRFGFAYETEIDMERLKKYRGLLFKAGQMEVPERFAAGFSCDFTCYCHGAIDLELIRWSRTSLGRFVETNPPQPCHKKNKLGSQHGPGLGWRDQPLAKFGIDYYMPCLSTVFRAGYRWGRTPIPTRNTFPNILTLETVESLVTVGATFTPWMGHEFSICYAYGFNNTVHGDHHKVGPQFGGGIVNLKNGLQFAKVGYGAAF